MLLKNENVKLATTLYKTLPESVKQRLNSMKDYIINYDKNKKDKNKKELVVSAKYIDITKLDEDFIVELNVLFKSSLLSSNSIFDIFSMTLKSCMLIYF